MTMIRSLTVRNFQAHERFILDLDRVTTLTAPSDAGKSALLRALRWVCLNEPRGDAFVTHNKAFARVKVTLDSGDAVTRQTGTGGNLYRLNGGEPHKAFGSSVPDEIAKLLNVDAVNFQGQLDPPFWLLSSPGEVSRSLNKIVDLERIDTVLSRCSGQIRQTKAAITVCEKRMSQAESDCERLAWVEEAYRERQVLTGQEQDIARKRTELALGRDLINQARVVAATVRIAADAKRDALEVKEAYAKLKELADKVTRGRELIRQAREARRSCSESSADAARLRRELQRETKGLCPACGRPSLSVLLTGT